MTTADPLVYYPQYCFHLSPTINAWCPLRAADIASLRSQPGFEDINVFFYLNHPIQWVRIVGVVVAIDHYYGHQVYTVDDSTGQCIECTLPVPNTKSGQIKHRDTVQLDRIDPPKTTSKPLNAANIVDARKTDPIPMTSPPTDIDIGMVIDVKGSVKEFRGQRQIKIQKAKPVESTTQEVLFWDKIRDFRRDTLSRPWVLNDKEVRRCRRLQQTEAPEREEKRKRKAHRLAIGLEEGTGGDARKPQALESRQQPKTSVGVTTAKAAKTQRTARMEDMRSRIGSGDKYDALGL